MSATREKNHPPVEPQKAIRQIWGRLFWCTFCLVLNFFGILFSGLQCYSLAGPHNSLLMISLPVVIILAATILFYAVRQYASGSRELRKTDLKLVQAQLPGINKRIFGYSALSLFLFGSLFFFAWGAGIIFPGFGIFINLLLLGTGTYLMRSLHKAGRQQGP